MDIIYNFRFKCKNKSKANKNDSYREITQGRKKRDRTQTLLNILAYGFNF